MVHTTTKSVSRTRKDESINGYVCFSYVNRRYALEKLKGAFDMNGIKYIREKSTERIIKKIEKRKEKKE